MDDHSLIQQRIVRLRAELAELEIASRVLTGLRSQTNGVTRTRGGGRRKAQVAPVRKIADYASEILAGAGEEGMHFRDIAKEAMNRGYRGRKGSNDKSIGLSFWSTMHRGKKVFANLGQGRFRLK
jgi:hypothetical protein